MFKDICKQLFHWKKPASKNKATAVVSLAFRLAQSVDLTNHHSGAYTNSSNKARQKIVREGQKSKKSLNDKFVYTGFDWKRIGCWTIGPSANVGGPHH